MKFYTGTNGFTHQGWVGPFYDDVAVQSSSILSTYAQHMPCVEISNMFYRLPRPEVIEKWVGQTPASFRMVFSGLRRLTHEKRLRDADSMIQFFLKLIAPLEKRAGAVVYQLPALLRKDVDRLDRFLGLHEEKIRVAMMFKNPSWFSDDVYAVLKNHNASMLWSDDDAHAQKHFTSTCNWHCARLNRLHSDTDEALDQAAQTIHGIASKGEMFVIVPHSASGPTVAQRLHERLTSE